MRCPKCGCVMVPVAQRKGGFSVGKAAVGGIFLGPLGLLGGALGKKRETYQCLSCNYIVEK